MSGKTSAELVHILVREIDKYGQKQIAAKLEVSPQYLHDIINFRRGVSKELARKLGYAPKLMWHKTFAENKLSNT